MLEMTRTVLLTIAQEAVIYLFPSVG